MEYQLEGTEFKPNKKVLEYKGIIKIGIPHQSGRQDSKLTNAEILNILEHGSIVNNLPPRELLEPVVKKHKDKIDEILVKVVFLLISEKEDEADKLMQELAFRLETWTKSYFTEDNGWAPNAPITVNGGWMKNKKSGKPFYVKGKKSNRPMIDTGELRKSIRGIFIKE